MYATYAYVDATIREDGPNKGNRVPFSSKNKGSIGVGYTEGPWKANLAINMPKKQLKILATPAASSVTLYAATT